MSEYANSGSSDHSTKHEWQDKYEWPNPTTELPYPLGENTHDNPLADHAYEHIGSKAPWAIKERRRVREVCDGIVVCRVQYERQMDRVKNP